MYLQIYPHNNDNGYYQSVYKIHIHIYIYQMHKFFFYFNLIAFVTSTTDFYINVIRMDFRLHQQLVIISMSC